MSKKVKIQVNLEFEVENDAFVKQFIESSNLKQVLQDYTKDMYFLQRSLQQMADIGTFAHKRPVQEEIDHILHYSNTMEEEEDPFV